MSIAEERSSERGEVPFKFRDGTHGVTTLNRTFRAMSSQDKYMYTGTRVTDNSGPRRRDYRLTLVPVPLHRGRHPLAIVLLAIGRIHQLVILAVNVRFIFFRVESDCNLVAARET